MRIDGQTGGHDEANTHSFRYDANAPKTGKYSAQGTENNTGGKDRGIL
jgi:hypothetical protein